MSERNLTSGEISMLRSVFGNSIDYSKITLDNRIIPDSRATTIFNTISFPANDLILPDYSANGVTTAIKSWFVHEVAHVWQWQVNDVYTVANSIGVLVSHGFDYSSAYQYSINDKFNDMNIEQQAAAIQDRFLIANGLPPRYCIDCSPNLSVAGASLNQLLNGFDTTNSNLNNQGKIQPVTTQNLIELEHLVNQFDQIGTTLSAFFDSFTQWVSDTLVSIGNVISNIFGGVIDIFTPIGAFYDSQSTTYDNAPSVATKTLVLLDGNNNGLNSTLLAAMDANTDGKLNGDELDNLRAWGDINENGVADTGEITLLSQRGISEIVASDYGFFTRGNSFKAPVAPLPPTVGVDTPPTPNTQPGVPGLPGAENKIESVPASNYRTLRDEAAFSFGGYYWGLDSTKLKVSKNQANLVGTDNNDEFDIGALADTPFDVTKVINFLGGNGDDTVGGSTRADNIWGGIGNDTLIGYAGDDNLYGEDGNDQLNGQDGADYLDGGVGDDVQFGGNGADVLNGGEGNDYLDGENDIDYLYGGNGTDTLYGGSSNDYLDGGNHNDALLGEEGDDRLFGGAGLDELQGGYGNDKLVGAADNDKLFGQTGNDILWGGDGNDYLQGFTASNESKQTLTAGESDNDLLYGERGADTLEGGLGNDTLDGGDDNDLLWGGANNDNLYGGAGTDQLVGDDGDDMLDGGVGNDSLFGEDGVDRLFGDWGADELQGGYGNDRLSGEGDKDRLFGQTGDDILWGGVGDDILLGFTASNESKHTLNVGESDNDILYGGDGVDNLYGDLGNDSLDGGNGDDLLSGEDGDDRLFGGDGKDQLQGGYNNDRLLGEAGDDRLFGQVGNDFLWGDVGNDILVGFTASNESKQSLVAGETDNDLLYGGDGQDLLMGGLGDDQLYGENGDDELQAGIGNDKLYGAAGDDRLFGQLGNDVLYGGDGDDILLGFTASNESKQSLNAGESDNDWLYGGAGKDYLLGGEGSDYLDGGAGADEMLGGVGNDVYIVNSVNDSILEQSNAGYDTVISSANYLLNKNIEELRLLEGFDIHGTGNALNNKIIGNNRSNILDGVTGQDIMIGERGNDTYYVDNSGDQVVEQSGEGADRVQSSISYSLGANVEDLVLLDFSKPEQGLVDGVDVLVYGYPKMNELDYIQGDAVDGFLGTCALTAISNLLTQADMAKSEEEVVTWAINNNWTLKDVNRPAYELGGTTPSQQQAILSSYGLRNDLLPGYNAQGLANLVMSGRGVILGVNAGKLWGENAYVGDGKVNHAVTVTGVVYNESDGSLKGFYIADSGRHKVSDMTRFVDMDDFIKAANVGSAYAIYTLEPVKLWNEDINGTGNDANNVIIGNRGDNTLSGRGGNDSLSGGAGDDILSGDLGVDTMIGGEGNDTFIVDNAVDEVTENAGEGTDMVKSSVTYTLAANTEDLLLIGSNAINGVGNTSGNTIQGNNAANNLDGGIGSDVLIGGLGNDRLTGGSGMDVFRFNTALTANMDIITDFTVNDDTIQLDNAIFTKLSATGVLNASWFVKAAAASDLLDYVIYNPTTGAVIYDADGSGAGAGVQIAQLGVNLALTNADFVII